jgi:energy-coupling factor transporter ATP-binding protein EcfA2
VFDDGSKYGMGLDRWPYKTESTEAVFADEFVHPQNGPAARQDFPSYDETVYSFQYGAVKIIGFNTNYWPETDTPKDKTAGINQKTRLYGGNPEGYVMCEQVEWIKRQIEQAKVDETVKYIVLFAHEPMFPNGKHQIDAMWYSGDNGSRAHSFRGGKLKPEAKGVIEVRNELARAIAASPKVAVVINSDEHAYYRTLIGYIMQSNILFSGTISENIAIGEQNPDHRRIAEVAKLADAHDFISKMPRGYEQLVGERGVGLSGGQIQRICIARALYHDPRLLILDEATSALDSESESHIQSNMRQILKGRTAVIIAHRLSTIMNADRILVLYDGGIVEEGTHAELLAKKGMYHHLVEKQVSLGEMR